MQKATDLPADECYCRVPEIPLIIPKEGMVKIGFSWGRSKGTGGMVVGWTTTSGRPLEQPRTSSSYFWDTIRHKVIRVSPYWEKGGYDWAGSAEECGGAARLRVGLT